LLAQKGERNMGARACWASAVLAACVMSWPARCGEDPGAAVSVSAARVRVANGIDAGPALNASPPPTRARAGTSIELSVKAERGNIEIVRAWVNRVSALTDGNGQDLRPAPDPDRLRYFDGLLFPMPEQSESDRTRLTVEGERSPSAGSALVRAEGSVTALVGVDPTEARQEGFRLEKGQKIEAGPVSLEVTDVRVAERARQPARIIVTDLEHLADDLDGILGFDQPSTLIEGPSEPAPLPPGALAGTGTRTTTVTFTGRGRVDDLAGVEFLHADGQQVETVGRSVQSHVEAGGARTFTLGVTLAETLEQADLVVRYWDHVEEVEAPFSVEVSLPPGIAGEGDARERAAPQGARDFRFVAELRPRPGTRMSVPCGLAFRSVALHVPYAYVLDRGGTLYVYRIPEQGWAIEMEPLAVLPDAGDGMVNRTLGDVLLCSRGGGLDVYSLETPEEPARRGSFGPGTRLRSAAMAVSKDHLFMICRSAIVTYDVSTPAEPELMNVLRVGGRNTAGTVVGDYLYLGTVRADGEPGIAVLDVSDPAAPTEVGAVSTRQAVWHLFGTRGSRLLASLDADSLRSFGRDPHGNSALFSLVAPARPELVAEIPDSGGRAAVLWPVDGQDYYVCNGAVFLVGENGLTMLPTARPTGSNLDGFAYHCDACGSWAAVATDSAVTVMGLR